MCCNVVINVILIQQNLSPSFLKGPQKKYGHGKIIDMGKFILWMESEDMGQFYSNYMGKNV
jgi:hypothetical protein